MLGWCRLNEELWTCFVCNGKTHLRGFCPVFMFQKARVDLARWPRLSPTKQIMIDVSGTDHKISVSTIQYEELCQLPRRPAVDPEP